MSHIPPSGARQRRDLPVWDTVCASYRAVFIENLNHLPNAAIGPLVLSLVIGALLVITGGSLLTGGRGGASVGEALLFIVLLFVAVAPYVIFAVAWHRLILLGPAVPPTVIPTWRDRHWRFYGYSLHVGFLTVVLLAVIVGVPLLIVYYVIGSRLLQGLTAVVAFAVVSAIILRLCLVLPATAVDERYGFGDAMRQSEGQGLRFFAAVFLIALPFFLVDGIARLVLVNPSAEMLKSEAGVVMLLLLGMIWLVLHTIISYLESAVIITFLSLAFRHLSGWRPEKPDSRAPAARQPPTGDADFGSA